MRDDVIEPHRAAPQFDPALRDARDVEQVVDQSREMLDLPLDGRERRARVRIRYQSARQQLAGVADRRERIAQLVGEHRQELVLLPVGLFELLPLLFERFLGLATLGYVARGAEPLDDLTVRRAAESHARTSSPASRRRG